MSEYYSRLQSVSMFTFILDEVDDVLVELVIQRHVDDVARRRVAHVGLLTDTQLDTIDGTFDLQCRVHTTRVMARLRRRQVNQRKVDELSWFDRDCPRSSDLTAARC